MLATRIRRLACAGLVAALAACGSAPVGPGYYRVERGDTLSKIARANRQSVQNIVRWNSLSNPDSIEVGQVLRVAPPSGTVSSGNGASRGTAESTTPAARGGTTADSTPPAAPSAAPAAPISLVWPAAGNVVRGFDGKNSKGIDISNSPGTPVVAAARGTVVYAGNGLRGYGNLLIIKHNGDYLTAYAHNRTLLVKEGQTVAQGQKIAEMGDTDSDRTMLHFELRYEGRSIDPSRSLPPR
ncbi:peptidoglycan DD-metalloendopeptidase family protein [Paraburkholderia kururiensis]|uniref:Peptidoglycan DD-metalloendopeptidase family protein n=1 Tax=Paraburkholderia kururiensis TaxID=984307 RepID=A0ABZ0WIL8_9BURK|nr:peptidoglycan DD-metalloendopeptidase family protein [Paraburkholderia kururiensis]WQD77195.1 peptidoglycan DD-metalloendopeptidase family protein [Paraburkholderia kururiensis]